MLGLVEATSSRYNDEPGRCVFLVGELTPTRIDEGIIADG